MSLKLRLVASLLAILLAFVGLGAFALNRIMVMRSVAQEINENWLPSIKELSDLSEAGLTLRGHVLRHMLQTTEADHAAVERQIEETRAEAIKVMNGYGSMLYNEQERVLYSAAQRSLDAYLRLLPETVALSRARQVSEAIQRVNGPNRQAFRAYTDALEQLIQFNVDGSKRAASLSDETSNTAFWMILATIGLGIVLVAGLSVSLVRAISLPVRRLTGAMERMTHGDLDARVEDKERPDEIGAMARALEIFRDKVREGERMAAEQARADEATKARARKVDQLVGQFGQEAQKALDALRGASQRLGETSGVMSGEAEKAQRLTGTLSAATENASSNAQTAAAATEELNSSIGEITRQVSRSAEVARRAVTETERTDRTVRELADTANKIGDVVRLIADIAGQTNLLALNATIEAARAGEAGKGFAVVASEVKNLASQTAKATEEISQQVAAIQGATGHAVEAIRSIAAVVTEIDQTSAAIAAAVEEQGAATQEIARNVTGTAQAAGSLSREVGVVRNAAEVNGRSAAQVREASGEVASTSETLRNQVDRFLKGIQAA
ncbi:methyl-accepting chemotaxis protein [Roseomonas sp. GC11]|uniref:methyl-accepting chemotaxis protein n=1 Tax=Roseomonas sp. GC11 TaxID=2950546 RepID=UPI00210CFC71|nr:methyl-accepting chemotaxis protein [Roseomonas sp. GC11]MCQ4159826.1 methyl-accepting chemotaxis protein [Roseomonas sp. GC11]